MDLPNNVTASGVALLVAASGRVDIKTTVLLTAEEVDAAVKVTGDRRLPPARGLSLSLPAPSTGAPEPSGQRSRALSRFASPAARHREPHITTAASDNPGEEL
jgi:hypothetical protein